MKNIALTVFTTGFLLALNSCCTKKGCHNTDEIYDINFYNFSEADLDSITIVGYSKDSNFTTKIDSLFTYASVNGSNSNRFTVFIDDKINANLDYKIKLLSIGQVFTLTDFEIKREGCNSCFPLGTKTDFYNKLNSYQVNGKKQTEWEINIYK